MQKKHEIKQIEGNRGVESSKFKAPPPQGLVLLPINKQITPQNNKPFQKTLNIFVSHAMIHFGQKLHNLYVQSWYLFQLKAAIVSQRPPKEFDRPQM